MFAPKKLKNEYLKNVFIVIYYLAYTNLWLKFRKPEKFTIKKQHKNLIVGHIKLVSQFSVIPSLSVDKLPLKLKYYLIY